MAILGERDGIPYAAISGMIAVEVEGYSPKR
jgi:hypothetical protein